MALEQKEKQGEKFDLYKLNLERIQNKNSNAIFDYTKEDIWYN